MQRKVWTIVLLILLGVVLCVCGWKQYLEKQQKETAKQARALMLETTAVTSNSDFITEPIMESTNSQEWVENEKINDAATVEATEVVLTVTTGELVEATMNNITILTQEEKKLNFLTTDAQMIAGEKGLLLGETVAVTYDRETPVGDNYWVAQVVKVIK